MLKLDTAAQPRWITVSPGVRLLCRPSMAADFLVARTALSRRVKSDEAMSDDEADVAIAEGGVAYTAAFAKRVVLDWEGVGDADGNPLPFSTAHIEMLITRFPVVRDGFDREFVVPALIPDEEKNVSSGSLNGTLAAGRPTAKPAVKPAKRAPTSPKNPKPKTASSRGKSSARAPAKSEPRSRAR